jgi:peptide chain release factor subunit 1
MISRQDLERIVSYNGDGDLIVSVFLDMSVDGDNKRNHQLFLSQRRAQFDELESERPGHPRQGIGEALERVESWLAEEYDEANRGVVIYASLVGDWFFEAFQFPVAVENRLVISEHPVVGPLAQVLESYDHHGVVLVDREHVRILSVYLGTPLDEVVRKGDPIPTRYGVQAGGYSQSRYQRRKVEEVNRSFREFADEVEKFVGKHQPDDLILLGTEENVGHFREFLPEALQLMILMTGSVPVDESVSQVVAWLEPHIEAERDREAHQLIQTLRERVEQDYLATAGYARTLMAIQEGKVDTLVIERNQERLGARCEQCGFVFASGVDRCPFDGAVLMAGVDVAEEAVRLAEVRGAEVEFVDAGEMEDLAGIGALLRF